MNKYDTMNECQPVLVVNWFTLHNLQDLSKSIGAVLRLAVDGNNLNFKNIPIIKLPKHASSHRTFSANPEFSFPCTSTLQMTII